MGTKPPTQSFNVILHPGRQRTWVSVIRKTFHGDAVIVSRLGHVPLDVPQRALDGLSDVEAVQLLVWLLAASLGLPDGLGEPPASPSGDHGGEGWSQPTLDLDLRP